MHKDRGDIGLLILRVSFGLALALTHGLGKLPPSARFIAGVEEMGFPLPALFAWAAGFAEFGGGILLALGLLTRPAALLIAVNMFVAVFIRQAGDPFGERELAAAYMIVAVCLLFTGSGRFGLDDLLRRRNRTREATGEATVESINPASARV